ncbi:MAG: hypothetical protein IPL39_20145 [Opitutaceae bacterium]|nr:hypothetical protein [Opitutaceae bacterium]
MKITLSTKGANTARLQTALREALDRFEERHVLLPEELPFIRDVRYMKPVFIDNLRDMRLHPKDYVRITEHNGELQIVIEGGIQAILFEQLVLTSSSRNCGPAHLSGTRRAPSRQPARFIACSTSS